MPIPPFNLEGLLPSGIHRATLEETLDRFGKLSPARVTIGESLVWVIGAARRAGVVRFIIDGSFVDSKREPNDVDCVALTGPGYPADPKATRDLDDGFPFVHLVLFDAVRDFEEFVRLQFMTDRMGRPWGVVEIQL